MSNDGLIIENMDLSHFHLAVQIGQGQESNSISEICANLHNYLNNAMSNDGSSIEIIDLSHGD